MFWWERDGVITVQAMWRGAAEMWVWPASCHSVRWAGTRWRAQHLTLPLAVASGRCVPLPARLLRARRGPFRAKDIGAVTCV
jgi:hypothetical protein